MQEVAWAAVGRDRAEWDRTMAVCVVTIGPWLGIAEALSGKSVDLDIMSMHPYGTPDAPTKTKEPVSQDEIKSAWKGFVRSPIAQKFARRKTDAGRA